MPGTARDHALHLPKRRIVRLITIRECAVRAHHNAGRAHHNAVHAHVDGAAGVRRGARNSALQRAR